VNEVKNVARQGLTAQLRDYIQYASSKDMQFNLYINEETKISQPLQDLIDAGTLNHFGVPMN